MVLNLNESRGNGPYKRKVSRTEKANHLAEYKCAFPEVGAKR